MSLLIDNNKVEKQQRKAESKRDRELSDIRFLLKFPEFRRFYYRLIGDGGLFSTIFHDENSGYLLGRRSLSLDFFRDLNEAKPEAFLQMQQEHMSERKSEQIINDIEERNNSKLI